MTSSPIEHALILADGSVDSAAELDRAWPDWRAGVGLVVAADGGAHHADALGLTIDRWVGDGDSVRQDDLDRLAAAGVTIEQAPTDKDETDAELALLAALAAGADRITILGALGGARLDHELGNIWLLGHPGLVGHDARLLDARTRIRVLAAGRTELAGHAGDLVSLLPFGGDVVGVTTEGLRYPLRDEPLVGGPSRGLSNVRLAAVAAVTIRMGRLLAVEAPARLIR